MSLTPAELVWLSFLGIASGTLGAIAGVGGGVIIVPALVTFFGFDFPTAVAASLAAVIANSTTAGGAYVGGGLTNMRLATTLEIATALGGISGGLLVVLLAERVLAGVFAALMAATSILVARRGSEDDLRPKSGQALRGGPDRETGGGRLDARYRDHDTGARVTYHVERVPLGFAVSYGAGITSGLVGVGGGFITVPAMNVLMGVPLRVAAATSNLMIGVTAVASFLVYLARGEVHPAIVTPLVLGSMVGAMIGSSLQTRMPSARIRTILMVILAFVAAQMAMKALGADFG